MNLCCPLVAFCRCLVFSVSSPGLNLGMVDIISQIHPKVVLSLTLAFGPAPLLSEFHFQDKQNAEKLGLSFTQPYSLPPHSAVNYIYPRSFLRMAATGVTHASVSNPNKLDLNRIFSIPLSGVKRDSLPRKSKASIFPQALALKELSPFNAITLGNHASYTQT